MTTTTAEDRLSPETRALVDEVITLRRDFHKHPELDFELPRTAQKVAEYLEGLGLPTETGIGKSGIIATLEGGKPGPTALYRADMDALPLLEETGLDFASVNEGVMHACGHDGHIAVGLTLAKLMTQQREKLPGKIVFLFQPAEEGGGGALEMIKDGVLDKTKPDACFAMHLNNDEQTGEVGAHEGGVFGGSGEFFVELSSPGGHGANPQQTVDLVVTAAAMIDALQSVISRNTDPLEAAVVTVGQIHIGTKENILATSGRFSGTIRHFNPELNDRIVKRVEELLTGIAQAYGAGIRFTYDPGYPVTANDPAMAALAREAIAPVATVTDFRTTGSEDMSYFLNEIPGCYYTVGSANTAKGKIHAHHSGSFDIDEDSLPIAVEVGKRVLEKYLREGGR